MKLEDKGDNEAGVTVEKEETINDLFMKGTKLYRDKEGEHPITLKDDKN